MRRKLRAGGQSVSFFAFQDIITAVIGIVLFISLLLSLFAGVESSITTQTEVHNAASPEELSRLDRLINKITDLKAQVTSSVLVTSEKDAKLRESMLQEELASLENQLAKSPAAQAVSGAPKSDDVRKEIENLTALNNNNKSQLEALRAEAEKKSGAVASLTAEVEKREADLLEEQRMKDDIWLIPSAKNTTKRPLIVIANIDNFVVKTLDAQGSQGADRQGTQLKDLLADFDPVDYFVVMYYRPSTFHIFKSAAKTIRGLNFDFGYDAIGEDQNINFRKSKTP